MMYPKPKKKKKLKKYLPRVKKSSRGSLSRKADKLFSLKVRARGYCELNGLDNVKCGGMLQCAHIVGRTNRYLRWDENNTLSLCAGHHSYYTYHAWEWSLIIAKFFPTQYEYVNKYRNEIWDKDTEKILEGLQ